MRSLVWGSRPPLGWLVRLAVAFAVLTLGIAIVTPGSASVAHAQDVPEMHTEPDGTIVIDEDDHDHADHETWDLLGYISDCQGTQAPPRCGDPPARWAASARPVQYCTFQGNRPAWLSADEFRRHVREAAAVWNGIEAAIGISYSGDCAAGTRWATGNQLNEIGFDDERDAVSGRAIASTLSYTTWTPSGAPTTRGISEADIIVHEGFANMPGCFFATLVHEFGHALGFAHSTDVADVMYPSINPNDPASCKAAPSAYEGTRLQDLYGLNRTPVVTGTASAVGTDGTVTLTGSAMDPDGDPVLLFWEQVGGPAVGIQGGPATVTFTAPAAGTLLDFRVTGTDSYLHSASAVVNVTVGAGGTAPTGPVPAATAFPAPAAVPSSPLPAPASTAGVLPSSGFGLFVFGGGPLSQLVQASGCPAETAAFWTTTASGDFVIYVPGTSIAAVNAGWFARFPDAVPASTPLVGRCRP